jgi:two-component system phosphate regulon response regulator OmpR
VLVVEDARSLADVLVEGLRDQGMAVDVAYDGLAAAAKLDVNSYDVVVLDRDLPGLHGDTICQMITDRDHRVMVLMLTAAGSPGDRVSGLGLGADDYLAKPFEPQELVLRIEAILRRAGPKAAAGGRIQLGLCSFDLARGELWRGDEPIRLTEGEAQLLRQLAGAANAPVDRFELARQNAEAAGRAVDIQVTRLRRKIEADPKNPRYLQTVRGIGYMLAPDN